MHLHVTNTESGAVEVEYHIIMLAEQRHRDGTVGDLLGDHKGGQTHTERIVVMTWVPDGDAFAFPGLDGTDGESTAGNVLDGTAAGGTGILDQGDRVKLDQTGAFLTVFGRGRRIVFVSTFTTDGVVESPVFGLSLTTLNL